MADSIEYRDGKTRIQKVYSGTTEVLILSSVRVISGFDDKNYAFRDCCSTISTIKFQENSNLEIIEPYSFYNCKLIKNLDLSKCTKLKEIRKSAFNTTDLGNIQLPDSLEVLGESAFANSGLTTIRIPKLVKKLEDFCFCATLSSITFDDESLCTQFGGYCFRYSSIESIRIPKKLQQHGWACFEGCSKLREFTVQDGSSKYSAHDGVLYNNDQTTLHFCPAAKTGEHRVATNTKVIDSTSFTTTHLSSVIFPNGLEVIGSYTFSSDTLTSIELPDTVTGIGTYCFSACTQLSSIKFSAKLTFLPECAFQNTAFETITIPEGITNIGPSCFANCRNLKIIRLPKSLSTLGGGVFTGCNIADLQIIFNEESDFYFNSDLFIIVNKANTSLKQYLGTDPIFTVPDSIIEILNRAFYELKITEIIFTENTHLKSIGDETFYHCTELSEIEIPATVTTIGKYVFESCTKLSKIVLPNSLETIGEMLFKSSSVTEVDFQSCKVKDLPQEVFSNCKSLTTVTLPPQLETIGLQCFANCELINALTFPSTFISFSKESFIMSGVTEITFSGEPTNLVSICDYAFYSANKLSVFNIPASVTSIGLWAFRETNIATVNIPCKCREIKDYCFSKCPKLDLFSVCENSELETLGFCVFEDSRSLREIVCNNTHFTVENGALLSSDRTKLYVFPPKSPVHFFAFPQRVKTISRSSFYGCENLVLILIPDDSVETIEQSAFSYCSNLEMINIPQSVKTIGLNSFLGCNKLTCGVKVENQDLNEALVGTGKMNKSALTQCSKVNTCDKRPAAYLKRIWVPLFSCFIISC